MAYDAGQTTAVLPPAVVRRRRADLVRRVSTAGSVTDVFAAASRGLHGLVPHDSAAWLMTDPATGLPSAPSLLDDFTAPATVCTEHWHREFVDSDINPFRQLARAERPAAALRATAVDPERSSRYRWFVRPLGFADELRAVMRVRDRPWAMVTLWRREGRPAFSPAEADLVASLSAPLTEALQRCVREDHPADVTAREERPGLLMFDERGRLASANEHAAIWLDELPQQELVPTRFGLHVPVWLLVTAIRARESLVTGGDGVARTRVRSRQGRWLVGHASTTRAADGSPAGTAVVIEPAGPAVMAPVIVEAYGLTDREQEITAQIARGAGTGEIADALFLSPHTVRDHVKSILGKVGVSSRGELVATLYLDHFEPAHVAGLHVVELV
jgi:DNA-binding CsgD family transcriptional regulator